MVTKPFLAARIPEDLNTKLEEHSASTGEGKTQAVINALANYLNFTPESKSEESAGDRLSLLEKKVAELEDLIKEPKQFSLLESISNVNPAAPAITLDNIIDNTGQDKSPENNQGVINLDNTIDNEPDNNNDNADNSEVPTTEEGLKHPNPEHGTYLGQMKTQDVPNLPGLESQDPRKIKSKLGNTRHLKSLKVARIDPYVLFLTLLDKGEGKKKELIWDVYKTKEE